jgi:hypothetical protein
LKGEKNYLKQKIKVIEKTIENKNYRPILVEIFYFFSYDLFLGRIRHLSSKYRSTEVNTVKTLNESINLLITMCQVVKKNTLNLTRNSQGSK